MLCTRRRTEDLQLTSVIIIIVISIIIIIIIIIMILMIIIVTSIIITMIVIIRWKDKSHITELKMRRKQEWAVVIVQKHYRRWQVGLGGP